MKKLSTLLITVFAAAWFVFFTGGAYAIGLGLYGTGGGGAMSWDGDGVSEVRYGGGFVFDTNCAEDYLFNYRLNFGVGGIRTKYKSYDTYMLGFIPFEKTKTHGTSAVEISMTHTFGFGVYRSKNVRFWVGPELLLVGCVGNVRGFTVGFGLALGLNINIGEFFTLSISGSGRFRGGYRAYEYTEHVYSTIVFIPPETNSEGQGGYGGEGNASLAFLFRINDTYGKQLNDAR